MELMRVLRFDICGEWISGFFVWLVLHLAAYPFDTVNVKMGVPRT